MKRTKLANRYAKALFDFAVETNQLEEVSKDVILVDNTFSQNKELQRIIVSPIIRTDKKVAILEELFKKHMTEISYNYLIITLQKGREIQVPTICEEYVKLYKKYKKIITLELHSAEKLDDSVIEGIKNKVKSFTHASEIELKECISPKLIGGFFFKFGDYCFDASVKTNIRKLKKALLDKTYQADF